MVWLGPHPHFVASTVRMSFPPSRTPIIEGDDPNWNEPPYLEDFEVDPDPPAIRRFTLVSPTLMKRSPVQSVLDGKDYPMKLQGKVRNYEGALYYDCQWTDWGPHVSRFVASDGVHVTLSNSQPMPSWKEKTNGMRHPIKEVLIRGRRRRGVSLPRFVH